ncbi:hypothetical protein PMZ80_006138 [Knufia obscura]|uniref:Uncharacterized protein n=2 Tax=Knufia TaxID=430999 RepID=A0AAN8FAU7_9EURO|nr:hypothetical protein PMZ80_006138 [Knufia obscura]KAK5954806.1 hypothetical protein OHC33_004532 [Knufia fluminis]
MSGGAWTGAQFMIGSRGDRDSIKKATWMWPRKKAQMHSGRVGKRCSSVNEGVKTRVGEEVDKVAAGARDIKRISQHKPKSYTRFIGWTFTKEVEEGSRHGSGLVECDIPPLVQDEEPAGWLEILG